MLCFSTIDNASQTKRHETRLLIISEARPTLAVSNLVLWDAIILLCPMGAHPMLHPRDLSYSEVHIQSTRLIEITFSNCINQTMLHMYIALSIAFNIYLEENMSLILPHADNYFKLIIKKKSFLKV